MATSGHAVLPRRVAPRPEVMADDDDQTQVSGSDVQRLAGITRQAAAGAHAHQVAASQAAAQRRMEQAMSATDLRERKREPKRAERARKRPGPWSGSSG